MWNWWPLSLGTWTVCAALEVRHLLAHREQIEAKMRGWIEAEAFWSPLWAMQFGLALGLAGILLFSPLMTVLRLYDWIRDRFSRPAR